MRHSPTIPPAPTVSQDLEGFTVMFPLTTTTFETRAYPFTSPAKVPTAANSFEKSADTDTLLKIRFLTSAKSSARSEPMILNRPTCPYFPPSILPSKRISSPEITCPLPSKVPENTLASAGLQLPFHPIYPPNGIQFPSSWISAVSS